MSISKEHQLNNCAVYLLTRVDGDIKEHHVETLKQLSSQVSPFLPSVHPRSPDPIPILDNLLATHKGSIVHIRSDAYADRSAGLAEVYLETHSSNSVEMVRFNFNSHDIRYNNITAMLRTWLCQVSFHNMKFKLWPTSRVLEYMRALQAWTEKDLFLFWFRFIMDESDSDTIYIIGGLDQCDSSVEQFLSSLGRLFTETEHPLRIIVTTTKEHDVGMRDKLHATMPPEVYQELQVDTNNLLVEDQEDLSVRLDVLLQRNPRYLRAGLGQRIAEIIDSSQLDGDLKHVVTTWLACNHIPLDSIESHVASLTPPTPELVFECILSGMPTERQGWARQLLFLVLQSVRAIRAEEFWIFSQTVFNEISCGKVESALSWFGGLLRIQYDEVQVGHPRLRNWLDAGHVRLNTRAWWRYDSKSQGHFDILETCLNILRHPGKHIYQPIPPGFHSLPYAVQFWHMHYQEVHKEVGALATSASQSALDFFADSTAFQKWIQAYISITDPFTAPDPTSTRPLPMASHLGLRDLVTALEIEYPEDLTDALIEAARKGHLEIVRHLAPLSPKQFRLQDPKLEKLLKAATSSGKNEVVGEILDLIPRHNPDSEEGPAWISELLPQACWLGNDQLVGILLDLGADPRTPMQYSNGEIRPLDLSIQTRKINVTKLLLERDAALCLDHSQLPRMLGVWADLEIMELLLANGYKVEAEADGFTALETACINGRPMIADFLLTQRPSLIDNIDTRKGAAIVCSDNENVKTLRVMLKHGVDVNAVPSDAPDGNALRGAISNDRLDICQLLVQHKIEVNDVSGGITPPVVRAVSCTEQSVAILRLLLDNGADPEKKEPVGEGVWGRTALLVASALDTEDAPEMIKVLLEHHADTSARDSDGWTPSYTAANFGRVNNLRLLIDAGADLYAACGPLKWNSLQGAFHDAEVVRLLLDNHMDPFEKYEADCSVLELSARNNKPSCVEGMLKRSGERKESAIAEALQAAVSWASPETVRLLLDAGADVDRTSDKRTLLSRALEEGNEDIIRMILEFRPHLDHPDLDDKTLLHFIGSDTTFSSLKLLVNAGARIDGVDNDGRSPLTSAVEDGNMVAMRYLLMKPAARLAINICGPWGAPLHVACWRPSFEMVTALIENGADANLSYEGEVVRRTPIAQACVARGDNYDPEKKRVVEYLLEDAGAVATGTEDTTSPIHLGTLACSGDLVKLLIRHGANPAHRDEIGRKPIHLACYNSLEALEALNASDEDFAAKDKLGRVPLHFAVLSSQLELLKYVLERSKKAGLDIDVRDNDGWTPLLWAARGTDLYIWDREQREIRAKEVIGFLLDNAADPAARGYVRRHFGEMEIHEWSASDVAAYHGLSELTEILAGADPSASRNANVKAGQTIGNEPKNIYCDGCYVVSPCCVRPLCLCELANVVWAEMSRNVLCL